MNLLLAESTGPAASITMSDAISSVMSVVSTVMTTIQGNTVLMAFFCAGLVGVAVSIVRRLVGRY